MFDKPELQSILSDNIDDEYYALEKSIGDHRVYVYYHLIYPLMRKDVYDNYAVVDFIGFTAMQE